MKTRKQATAGAVRIIGGQWRRRRIPIRGDSSLRPTPDRVRETVFNWLERGLHGARCLDLFAGSGALGFEALSRGAAHTVFVEQDRRTADALSQFREVLGAEAEVVCDDVRNFLDRTDLTEFDIVFIDPPYVLPVGKMLERLGARLAPGTQIYLERNSGDEWPLPAGLKWSRRATAGAVAFGLGELSPDGKRTGPDSPE